MAGEECETNDKLVPGGEMLIPRTPLDQSVLTAGMRRVQFNNSNPNVIRVRSNDGYIVEVEVDKIKTITLINGKQISIQ